MNALSYSSLNINNDNTHLNLDINQSSGLVIKSLTNDKSTNSLLFDSIYSENKDCKDSKNKIKHRSNIHNKESNNLNSIRN